MTYPTFYIMYIIFLDLRDNSNNKMPQYRQRKAAPLLSHVPNKVENIDCTSDITMGLEMPQTCALPGGPREMQASM